MSKSDGSTADYYELPAGCSELQELISHRNMNAQIGEIFRASYRYGMASHSDMMRDAKKIRFYADAEVKRLEKLLAAAKQAGCCATNEPAMQIDDSSPRAEIIGQNGEMAEEIYPVLDGWIKWGGGERPVGDREIVNVMFADGSQDTDAAVAYGWDHYGFSHSIVAYRPAKDAK